MALLAKDGGAARKELEAKSILDDAIVPTFTRCGYYRPDNQRWVEKDVVLERSVENYGAGREGRLVAGCCLSLAGGFLP